LGKEILLLTITTPQSPPLILFVRWVIIVSNKISLPKVFNIAEGDLLINYGIVTLDDKDFGDYVPYLFYFQANQKPKPSEEVEKNIISNPWTMPFRGLDLTFKSVIDLKISDKANKHLLGLCEQWDGIPA